MTPAGRLTARQLRKRRAHREARDPKCDTVSVLNLAALLRWNADMNAVEGLDDDWNLHYPEGPEANHFTHRATGRYRRRFGRRVEILERIPVELRHKPIAETPTSQIRLWRKNVGSTRRPRWVPPFTCAQRQVQANRRHVTVGWELKSRGYADPVAAIKFVARMAKVGGRWFPMTLVNMWGWAQKLTGFHNAGRQPVLLAHGEPRPAELDQYYPGAIAAISGKFAKETR